MLMVDFRAIMALSGFFRYLHPFRRFCLHADFAYSPPGALKRRTMFERTAYRDQKNLIDFEFMTRNA